MVDYPVFDIGTQLEVEACGYVVSGSDTALFVRDMDRKGTVFSKILLMLYMFFGRVGIMTVVIAFMMRSTESGKITYPTQRLMIG